MLNKRIKSGFTLIELMVFFIFISLILAAATPLITKRVKNIPLKFNHGTFICYGDHYELYNSSRLVSRGDGCKFTPPRRTALYKIELVGAGAGGYSYKKIVKEDYDKVEGMYQMTGRTNGKGYVELSESQAWNVFRGAEVILTVGSGNGYGGTPISMGYLPAKYRAVNPCEVKEGEEEKEAVSVVTSEHPEGELISCKDINKRFNEAEANVLKFKKDICPDYYESLGFSDSGKGYKCAPLGRAVFEFAKQEYSKVPTEIKYIDEASMYGSAGHGGNGTTLALKGKIDFMDCYGDGNCKPTEEKYKEYLKKLIRTYYNTGYVTSPGTCDGWYPVYKMDRERDGTVEGSDDKNLYLVNNDNEKNGKWGANVINYAAIKGWGKCATIATRATGGQGGRVYITEDGRAIMGSKDSLWYKDPYGSIDGDNAGGLVGSIPGSWTVTIDTSAKERTPYAKTVTQLNQRHHVVGNGGGAGSYEVAYAPSLSDDCEFNVASGGAALEGYITPAKLASLHNGLTTTLTCNAGTLRLKAEGGFYNTDTTEKVYSGWDYIGNDGTPKKGTKPFNTIGKGEESKYLPASVFTKYKFDTSEFGKGGDGSEIIDPCTEPYGHYWIYLDYFFENKPKLKEERAINRTKNCSSYYDVTYNPAKAGKNGAIIISW